nr:T9SS type A sorting domain-containing protein [Bacteroidota bacterium]
MKTKWLLLVVPLFLLNKPSTAQQSFEIIYGTAAAESFCKTFEDQNSDLVAIGSRNTEFGADSVLPLMVKYDKFGNLLLEKIITKKDTTGAFSYGFQKSNGNYLIIGSLSDSISPKDFNILYLCEFEQNFKLVWEKTHTLPVQYRSHSIENILLTSNNFLIIQGRVDSSLNGTNDFLFQSLLDLNGNMPKFMQYENWKDFDGYGELVLKQDTSGFFLFGDISENSIPRDWIEFDNSLNIIDFGWMEDSLSYSLTPQSIKRLSNGNLFMANKSYGIQIPSYQDLEIRILNPDFNIVKDTIIYFENNVYLPVNNGVDFVDENRIWVGSFTKTPPFFSGIEVFHLHIFDAEMNLKGVKEFGGENRFWLYDLTVLSDGGCLVTGIVPDYNGSNNCDGYILKVMPEDIITLTEEITHVNDDDIQIYPNPFCSEIIVKTTRRCLQFSLFDEKGILVLSERITKSTYNKISVSHLLPGFFFYVISIDNQIIENGKLIKNKYKY